MEEGNNAQSTSSKVVGGVQPVLHVFEWLVEFSASCYKGELLYYV
jgi:hypothetical protein